ncbi:MAG: hypothetical protein IKQ72_10500 [Bacteroidaceae bacterium]|nr:hypothetical protein [Bacteroidaceae bacterium]
MNRQTVQEQSDARFDRTLQGEGRPSVNKWSIISNIALTTLTAILSALGFTVG